MSYCPPEEGSGSSSWKSGVQGLVLPNSITVGQMQLFSVRSPPTSRMGCAFFGIRFTDWGAFCRRHSLCVSVSFFRFFVYVFVIVEQWDQFA